VIVPLPWWIYRPVVTACDLAETGACSEGVRDAVEKFGVHAMPTENAIRIDEARVKAAANADGDGYGDGSGSGSGSGYGDGDGSGSGYGDGSGSGSGYGSGDGGKYWLACLACFVAKLPPLFAERALALQAKGVKLAYWRSTANGQPANQGVKIDAAAPGVIHKVSGPLKICTSRALHATLIPPKWKGEKWWIVALHGEVVGDDEKMACLEREIIGECV
jgi:hypothetical protein